MPTVPNLSTRETPEGRLYVARLPDGTERAYAKYNSAYACLLRVLRARQPKQRCTPCPVWRDAPCDDFDLAALRAAVLADGRSQAVLAREWFGVGRVSLCRWLTGTTPLTESRRKHLRALLATIAQGAANAP